MENDFDENTIDRIKRMYKDDRSRIYAIARLTIRDEAHKETIKDLRAELRNNKHWPAVVGAISVLAFLYTMFYPIVIHYFPLP